MHQTVTLFKTNAQASGTLKDQYIAERAGGACIASVYRLEASFDLSFAAQVVNASEDDTKFLNKRLNWRLENPARSHKYVNLNLESLQLLVSTDASFTNNKNLSFNRPCYCTSRQEKCHCQRCSN
jgi:hypothetical protein